MTLHGQFQPVFTEHSRRANPLSFVSNDNPRFRQRSSVSNLTVNKRIIDIYIFGFWQSFDTPLDQSTTQSWITQRRDDKKTVEGCPHLAARPRPPPRLQIRTATKLDLPIRIAAAIPARQQVLQIPRKISRRGQTTLLRLRKRARPCHNQLKVDCPGYNGQVVYPRSSSWDPMGA